MELTYTLKHYNKMFIKHLLATSSGILKIYYRYIERMKWNPLFENYLQTTGVSMLTDRKAQLTALYNLVLKHIEYKNFIEIENRTLIIVDSYQVC